MLLDEKKRESERERERERERELLITSCLQTNRASYQVV